MLHLSAKSEYAIKALVCLALAPGDEPVQARQIVAFTGIPPKFLDQVMHDLRRGGLVESRRGTGGGYVLARDPATINFFDVVDMIDGSYGGKGRMHSGGQAEPLVAPVWDEVHECVRRILCSATIADAAARVATQPMMYHI
jgi:Rrf2 family protein